MTPEKVKDIGKICIPGMRLSLLNKEYISGPGTYELKGYIYATLAGVLKMEEDDKTKAKVTLCLEDHQLISDCQYGFLRSRSAGDLGYLTHKLAEAVESKRVVLAVSLDITKAFNQATIISVESPRTPSVLPKTGDVVTAKVTVVNSRLVQCIILCVGPSVLARPYKGILKKEDIKSTDKDRIDPYKCFRPGDVILARVLPMTEIHWYHLSTAENELGVVIATAAGSPQGVSMVPISWSEMQCPKTLVKEPRKVARVIPENINQALFPVHNNPEKKEN